MRCSTDDDPDSFLVVGVVARTWDESILLLTKQNPGNVSVVIQGASHAVDSVMMPVVPLPQLMLCDCSSTTSRITSWRLMSPVAAYCHLHTAQRLKRGTCTPFLQVSFTHSLCFVTLQSPVSHTECAQGSPSRSKMVSSHSANTGARFSLVHMV